MTAHLHGEHVPGCYRCELSQDEATPATPESAADLARAILASNFGDRHDTTRLARLVLAEAEARRADLQAIKAWRNGGMWDADLAPCLAAIDRLAAHQEDQP